MLAFSPHSAFQVATVMVGLGGRKKIGIGVGLEKFNIDRNALLSFKNLLFF